jgi:dihydrofolate reductase
MRDWAVKLEAKPKYVVSSTRESFPWANRYRITGDLRAGVQKLKDATPAGVLLGSGQLAAELDRLGLIDEYSSSCSPGSLVTARPCTRAGCPTRDGSNWSRRSRSAAA